MALQTFTAGQVLTAAQVNALQANDYNQTVSTKTADYVLVAADKGTRVEMNSGSATTITVDTDLFNAGDTLFIQNRGAGVCTITAGTATVSTAGSLALAQNAGGTLYFISAGVAVFYASGVATTSSGLTLINATSFSAVASQSINNVFTSTYQNYEIRLNITSKSALGAVNLRYRASGADNTTSNYNQAALLVRTSNASAGDGATAQTSILTFGTGNATYGISLIAQVFNPQIAQSTYTTHQFWGGDASTFFIYNGGSIFDATTAFDGFTIYPASGTITGTVYVYGLAK
jgi:hypothetical protein